MKQTGVADKKNMPTFAVRNILKGGEVRKNLWAIFMSATKKYTVSCPRVVG